MNDLLVFMNAMLLIFIKRYSIMKKKIKEYFYEFYSDALKL